MGSMESGLRYRKKSISPLKFRIKIYNRISLFLEIYMLYGIYVIQGRPMKKQ